MLSAVCYVCRASVVLALVLLFSTTLLAQDVGMGTRRGSGTRLEAPYTLDIETPHVKWANPLPGGPIRLLAVPTVDEGRTVVELAQRLSLDLTTVSIDSAWDVNKWTMSFGQDYGVRAERGDLRLIYSYLEQELTSTKSFDAILLPLHHGWNSLTPASREALLRRVREGCGLVLIQPLDAEVSPLVPSTPIALPKDPDSPVRLGNGDKSPWKRTGAHYVTRAIPVEAFPFEFLESYPYKAAPGAEVLIQTTAGAPVAAINTLGKGRVIAFGYRNNGISWHMPFEARIHPVDVYWEYFYSMLCRALIFAARREPQAAPELAAVQHHLAVARRISASSPLWQGSSTEVCRSAARKVLPGTAVCHRLGDLGDRRSTTRQNREREGLARRACRRQKGGHHLDCFKTCSGRAAGWVWASCLAKASGQQASPLRCGASSYTLRLCASDCRYGRGAGTGAVCSFITCMAGL